MDQRQKRLARLIAIYLGKILGVLALTLAIISLTVLMFGNNAPGVLILLVAVVGIGFMSYTMAKDKLDDMEQEERRVMDRMRRDN